ncbi:hypothetical protein F511_05291 [Dorcoceras hygrometricum]|uniref:Uncharacterized protein n=1 Tax=Dorcoceras hygrometricum TaxID=472368 RepID=A0A2Z7ASI3_9LAMI|nr:hypothetical protein F511_05291 [Dorcoceras hygrometricum]
MVSSLISNTIQIFFDSVLEMENAGMVAMFEAHISSGLSGFLGCLSAIYEAALVEFFQNASVRDGTMVSTVQGTPVEISEELFAGNFEFPMEVQHLLQEVEMKPEFRLMNDILAKSVTVKAGSFDAVTHERFLMMSAINGGVKINWGWLLFNIFKDMVTPGSRQARGYAVKIFILLNNVPNLELGDSKEFPPLKILTGKTVGKYIAINKNIVVEDLDDDPRVKKTPVKKAVSKKRPAATADAPAVKRKRTLVGRAIPIAKNLELVTVAQEGVPIQIVEPSPADDEIVEMESDVGDRDYRGLLNNIRQEIQVQKTTLSLDIITSQKKLSTQVASMATGLDDVRKDVQDAKDALSNDLLDFRAQAQENYNNIFFQLGELVDYINQGGNDKKGEGGSSSQGPQPSPDDHGGKPGPGHGGNNYGRGRGSRSEPYKKRGGGGSTSG